MNIPQRLVSISVENFRAYPDRTEVKIEPITLFFGYNSAGKSAIIRFLKLIADSVQPYSDNPLNVRSEALRGSSFSELVSKFGGANSISFEISFENISASYVIRDMPEYGRQIIEAFSVTDYSTNEQIKLEWWDWDKGSSALSSLHKFTEAPGWLASSADLNRPSFESLLPARHLSGPFLHLREALEGFYKSYYWISATRGYPPRWEVDQGARHSLSSDGSGVTSMLHRAPQEVIDDISRWYLGLTGYAFERQEILVADYTGFRYRFRSIKNPAVEVDIADTGEGMSQVLPVLALLALAKNFQLGLNPTLAFEHPELHIHPDSHKALSDIFSEASTSPAAPTILVETHSETFLLGIQLSIVSGILSSESIIVQWVRATDFGSNVSPIRFDQKAIPRGDNWPPNVFQSRSKIARDLIRKRES